MATAVREGEREVSMGRIFSRAFGAIGAHPAAMLGMALVFGGLPAMIVDILLVQQMRGASAAAMVGISFASTIINMTVSVITQAFMTPTVMAHGEGQRADIADTLPPVLMRMLLLVALGLVAGLGFAFGLALLVIPGLMLYFAWWVAAPAMVAERLGVREALARSGNLTRDARWKLVGVALIVAVAGFAVDAVLRIAGISWAARAAAGGALPANGATVAIVGIAIVVRTGALTASATLHASSYVELRLWKEGPATNALADVFR